MPHHAPMSGTHRILTAGAVIAVTGSIGAAVGLAATSGSATASVARPAVTSRPTAKAPTSTGLFAERLPEALNVNVAQETVTLPLYAGRSTGGERVWYIISDDSNRADARHLGANYSHKLVYTRNTKAVEQVRKSGGELVFPGTVNFSHKRVLVPSAQGFPPKRYAPGARGDSRYSPLIQLPNGTVLDAPQVANRSGLNGSVRAINYGARTVTLNLLGGWVDGQFTLYLHTDSSSKLVASLEDSNYAPDLNASPGLGSDAPPSSRAAIVPVVNGQRGANNPQRQGLQSNLLGQGDPFNVAQEQPSDPVHYTPIWDVSPVEWTPAAVAAGKRVELTSQAEVGQEARAGNIVSALPGKPDSSIGGIKASGGISNCPIVVVFPGT